MKNLFKKIFFCGILCAALDASTAATVSRTLVRQQWPWHAKVHVDYRLLNDDGDSVEVKVSVTNGTRAIALPSRALTGPRMGRLPSGDYRLMIDPEKIDFDGADRLDDFKVSLSVAPAPADADLALYRIYDLIARKRTDVTKMSLVNGEWGDVETTYDFAKDGTFNPSEVVIWTGVTNNPAYKTNCLVMRYVPAGSFVMLPTTNAVNVTLTKPYYIGVFEMTYAQCELIKAGRAKMYFTNEVCKAMRPMDGCSFDNIRGQNGRSWPVDETVSGQETYVYKIRQITGEDTFDLPTEARWEYAARAGTTTRWNNGSDSRTTGVANTVLPLLGRSRYSGGYIDGATSPELDCDATHGTAIVGSYLPNAWGLYDCHGNVAEWCLDRWIDATLLEGGTDPKESDSAEAGNRVIRSNFWGVGPGTSYMDYRKERVANADKFDNSYPGSLGFRLICEAE